MTYNPNRKLDPADSPAGWGVIPTIGGDVATAVPATPTGTSAVTVQQGDTATVQAISQKIVLPPPPGVVMNTLDPSGSLLMWAQNLIRKMGGYTATPSEDALILADTSETVDQAARASVDALALFDMERGQSQQVPTVADFWSDDSGHVHLSGDQQVYGAKTWMGKVGFFGTAATTKPAALTVVTANAPAGGVGTAAGGWDTAVNRDTAIALINNLKVRVGELESRLQSLGLLT